MDNVTLLVENKKSHLEIVLYTSRTDANDSIELHGSLLYLHIFRSLLSTVRCIHSFWDLRIH